MFVPLLAAALLPVYAALPVEPAGPALRGPAVVVLWASWCASCKAELERLPRLRAAAAPLPIRTLAIDSPDRARRMMAERGIGTADAYADARSPETVLTAWGGAGAVLPVAVAIDSEGRMCGRKLGLLGTDQLRQWAARCR